VLSDSKITVLVTQDRDLLVGDIFRNAARAVPARVAAALGDQELTFGAVDRRANQVGRALRAAGVGHGDLVAVWSPTSLDVVPLFGALAKIGAVFAPINPNLSLDEAAAMLSLANPRLVVVDDRQARPAADAVTLAELAALAHDQPDTDVACESLRESDAHVVFFTSGSTGVAKGVVLSHRVNFLRTHPGALLEERGAMVCPYPLFHMGAWTIAMQQWQARDLVAFVATADAASLCDAVERHQATRINCIPAVWRRLLDYGGAALSSVRFADTGTSATPIELLTAIAGAVPAAQIRVFYGSTEAGSVASLAHGDVFRKPGSCGVPAPSTEVRIADDGELLVRGPLVFAEYFKDPASTADAFVDGWYRTGDLAEIDAEGFLTIVGRSREVLRTGGETVSPTEVEAVLAAHPSVADVAVVGLPDPQWGEEVCAVVVARGAPPSLDQLREFCDGKLAGFKHPRRLQIVNAIPRTAATSQVQRKLLVEQLLGS
jgi:fatty-acyl-CoA synthase